MPNAIDNNASASNGLQSTPATGNRSLGKNEFLKLLTAQLANQDPLSPTDNQAFIAQLAQFASVEQAEAANSRLDAILMAQAANNQTATASLVGKDIVYRTDSVELPASGGATISGELSENAAVVNAIITDENGKKVRTITLTDKKAGTVSFDWDGKDENGTQLEPGKYKVQLTAGDAQHQNVAFTQRGRGRATGVSFEDGVPTLVIDGRKIKMSDVIQIAESFSSAAPAANGAASSSNSPSSRFTNLFTSLSGN